MDRIITRLGLTEKDPELLHDRRGTTVYKIGTTAVKITSGLMAADAARELADLHAAALAHTTAPEIADLILSSDDHVTTTPQSDIWSLGAQRS